jgi:hypothetical protein
MQNRAYSFLQRRANIFTAKNWLSFFKKYINSKKDDLPILWRVISLKLMDLLLKQYCVKLPHIGVLEVRVRKPKVLLYNDKPYFKFPISEMIFTPDIEFRKIFDKKFFATYEIQQLEDGTFDWMKKSNDTKKYGKRR